MYTNHIINRKLERVGGCLILPEWERFVWDSIAMSLEEKRFVHEEMLENKNYLQKEYARSSHEKVLVISQNVVFLGYVGNKLCEREMWEMTLTGLCS